MCDDGWSVVYGYGGKIVNAAGDTRHGRCGTARASMTSYGDHGELEHVNSGKCNELAWCSQQVIRDTESTGCVVGQGKQLMVWNACECLSLIHI